MDRLRAIARCAPAVVATYRWLRLQARRLARTLQHALEGVTGETPAVLLAPQFALYQPKSAGQPRLLAALTAQSIHQVFPALARLVQTHQGTLVPLLELRALQRSPRQDEVAQALKERFDFYGSDKANPHDYHLLYGILLAETDKIGRIFEVGLGTAHEDIPSNMGREGRPGASLRAFRD